MPQLLTFAEITAASTYSHLKPCEEGPLLKHNTHLTQLAVKEYLTPRAITAAAIVLLERDC